MRARKLAGAAVALPLGARGTAAAYLELTKPGIALMETVWAAAGFWLALPRNAHLAFTADFAVRFLATVAGTALVSAGSLALNHVLERVPDATMKRTMARPIPSGRVRADRAAVFGAALVAAGVAVLSATTALAATLAAATAFLYLAVYTPLKRRTPLSTIVGAVPGALPPLGGWVAVTGEIGTGGLLLFAVLFLWQMPHFLSLAWMYRRDYARGGFPLLTVRDESGLTVARNVVAYTLLLVVFTAALAANALVGVLFLVAALALGGAFVAVAVRFFLDRSQGNARAVLLSSYLYMLLVVTLLFLDKT